MLSHANLWFAGNASYRASYTPGITRTLVTLPLSHAFGLLVTVIGFHAVEPGVAALELWFDAPRFVRLVEELRIEQAPVVPSMLQRLLSEPLEEHDLSSLGVLTCGGAPLPPETALEIERRLPGVDLREGYGCTESASIISATQGGQEASAGAAPGGMSMPQEDDDRTYKVVVNSEEQYAIWFADREPPVGWKEVGKEGRKAECLEYVDEV
jgi:long-chain acyl-CoA synthetase